MVGRYKQDRGHEATAGTALHKREHVLLWGTFAFGCSALALLGWIVGAPAVSGFGFERYPSWPWSCVAFMLLSTALWMRQDGRSRICAALLSTVFAIGGIALLERVGVGFGSVDSWLFAKSIAPFSSSTPGRPGVLPSLSMIAIGAAIGLMAMDRRKATQVILVIAILVIGLNLTSTTLLLLGSEVSRQQVALVGSLPSCLPAIFLALACIEWLGTHSRLGLLQRGAIERRLMRVILPLIVGLPAVLLPIIDHVENGGALPPLVAELLAAAFYLFIIALVLVWSLTRVANEHEALNLLSGALDTVPILIVDRQDRISHWSQGCEALLGWTGGEAIGQRIDFHFRISAAERQALRNDAGDGSALRDLEVMRRDGQMMSVRAQTSRVGEARDGRVAIAFTDTTSLRRAQSQLEASEAKLQIAIETHQIGLIDWDIANDRTILTLHAAIHHGVPPGRPVTHEMLTHLIDPADYAAIEERRDEAIAQRALQYSFAYRTRPPGSDPRAIEGSARCFYDEEGKLVRVLGVTIDVTERHERATALEMREAQLRSIIATVPDAMLITARDGVVRNSSATAERMFGYERGAVTGKPLADLLLNQRPYGPSADGPMKPGSGPLAVGTPRNLIGRRANGEEFPVELFVAKTTHAEDAEFIAFVRDLSPRIAEQARIDALSNEYAHFARLTAIGAMAATLAHEINQPLAACNNFLGTARLLVQKGESGGRVTEMLRQAGEQILRAGEIIRRTREFIGKNEGDVSVEPLKPLIHEAVRLGMTGYQNRRVQLRFTFDEAAPEVIVDRIQIQQVIVNLVRNAAEVLSDKSDGPRLIRVSTTGIDEESVEVSVRDNGPGIPPHLLERIGQNFQSTKQGEGMGLGLSICRRIVETHEGRFSAFNLEDGGACFTFTIPRWSEPQMVEARA